MADGTQVTRMDGEQQRFARASILCDGCLEIAGHTFPCDILDISAGGAKIVTEAPLDLEREVVLQIGDVVSFPGTVVWQRRGHAGIEFAVPPEVVREVLPEILQGPARLREKRRSLRNTVLWSGEILYGPRTLACRILNVSTGGAKVRLEAEIPPGAEILIACGRFGEIPATVVWAEAGKIGVEFQEVPSRLLRAIGNAVTPTRGL